MIIFSVSPEVKDAAFPYYKQFDESLMPKASHSLIWELTKELLHKYEDLSEDGAPVICDVKYNVGEGYRNHEFLIRYDRVSSFVEDCQDLIFKMCKIRDESIDINNLVKVGIKNSKAKNSKTVVSQAVLDKRQAEEYGHQMAKEEFLVEYPDAIKSAGNLYIHDDYRICVPRVDDQGRFYTCGAGSKVSLYFVVHLGKPIILKCKLGKERYVVSDLVKEDAL